MKAKSRLWQPPTKRAKEETHTDTEKMYSHTMKPIKTKYETIIHTHKTCKFFKCPDRALWDKNVQNTSLFCVDYLLLRMELAFMNGLCTQWNSYEENLTFPSQSVINGDGCHPIWWWIFPTQWTLSWWCLMDMESSYHN